METLGIILIIASIILLSYAFYLAAKNKQGFLYIMMYFAYLCIMSGVGILVSRQGYKTKPEIETIIKTKVVNGEVVKSDTLYVIKIPKK